jgi:PmbA protein
VTNTEGGSASWEESEVAMAASNGLFIKYHETGGGYGVTALAGTGTGMEQDAVYEHRRYAADLPSLAESGRKAGERAVRKLNPRKGPTKSVPVVFAPEQASGLLMDFTGAINGAAIARGTSFLKDRMGQPVFGAGITIINDPSLPRGHRSRAIDGEGLAVTRRTMVQNGVLQGWFLDLRSARQLKLTPTGDAGRGLSSPPSPSASNLWIEPGLITPEALMGEIKEGLYIMDIIGHGLNLVTGDYSRGVMGFWIENGKLAYPVSEMTVAGNLKEMFLNTTAASDLTRRYGIDSPTLRISQMTVAGV